MYIFSQVHFYISLEGRVCYCIWWYIKRASTPEPRFTSFPMFSQHYGFEKLSLNCICWCWLISDLTVDRTIKWNSLLWSEWFQDICSFDTLHLSSAMAFYSLLVWDLENSKKKKKKDNSLSGSNICLLSTCPVQSNMLAPEKKSQSFLWWPHSFPILEVMTQMFYGHLSNRFLHI